MSLGPAEILVVLVLALIVFGPKRLPEVGRQVGGALRELRKVQSSVEQEIRSVLDDTTGPVRTMLHHSPEPVPDVSGEVPGAGAEPAAIEASAEAAAAVEPPAAVEPDVGDEHRTAPSAPAPAPNRAAPDIDGLSGGTFS